MLEAEESHAKVDKNDALSSECESSHEMLYGNL